MRYLSILGTALIVGLFLFCGSDLRAQGSPYDLLGFGMPSSSANPAIEALGGSGIALQGSRVVNDQNPADWTWLNRARLETALRYHYVTSAIGDNQSTQHNVLFSGFVFASPFWSEYKASLGIGYVPLTDAGALSVESDSLTQRTYRSRGGANLGFLGLSAQPIRGLALGARLDLVLGNIRHQDLVSFQSAYADSSEFERDYFFHGLRPTVGVEFIGDSLGFGGLSLGLAYSAGTSLSSTRETILTPLSSVYDTTIPESGNGYYPSKLSAGLSAHLGGRYRAEADYSMENYSKAFLFSTSNTPDPNLRNASHIGVGFERVANVGGEFGSAYGMDLWALRLGFSYSQLPMAPAGSGGVNEMAVTAGVGIPFGLESMLNVALTGGQRQPANTGTAPKETFLRLGASVSLSERWFEPTRRD